MSNDSRSLARLLSLETMVNDQVLRGTRDPRQVADVLQIINDDPGYVDRFFSPQPMQEEVFRIIEEVDLEVDFSLTPEQVFEFCQDKPQKWGTHAYIGQPPIPGVRRVKLYIGQIRSDVYHGNPLVDLMAAVEPEGFSAPGAWVATAYMKARPKWDKNQPYSIYFPPDSASRWSHTRPGDATPSLTSVGHVTIGKPNKGPWENKPHMNAGVGGATICALIRKEPKALTYQFVLEGGSPTDELVEREAKKRLGDVNITKWCVVDDRYFFGAATGRGRKPEDPPLIYVEYTEK